MNKTTIKLKDEELKTIEDIQTKNSEILAAFGLLYLDKMQIDEKIKIITNKEQKLQEEWTSLRKKEDDFINDLLKTYGEGSIDLKNGLFIPIENTTTNNS